MNRRQLLGMVAPIAGLRLSEENVDGAEPYPFSAAYFEPAGGGEPPQLFLFPLTGKAASVSLPSLPRDFALLAYRSDGKALYGRNHLPSSPKGLIQIEFKPTRASVVPGSTDFGISGLTTSVRLNRIFLYGWHTSHSHEYGIFELDPNTGASKTLLLVPDAFSGTVEDRRRRPARIVNPTSGTVETLGHGLRGPAWSPDGKWMSAVLDTGGSSKIVLIDANDMSRRKILTSTEDGTFQWSPDSKYLLLSRAEFCRESPHHQSLQALDIASGKRVPIPSSHCRVVTNSTGWLANDIVND
jgi:WD40 repeat protein